MNAIDKVLLAPYWAALKIRHAFYDRGLRKSIRAEVPTIAIGNVTVGGTGKTPHTELLLRLLTEQLGFRASSLAVLSRGYKRKSRGFQQVTVDGSAKDFGDEPLQIKRKFPNVTVAVDKNRMHGAALLCHPEKIGGDRRSRKCRNREMEPAELIVLDDALQYRRLSPDVSIMLIDWNRPVFRDHLLPIGELRDLPSRVRSADIVIVTKSPSFIEDEEKERWRKALGMRDEQELYFTETAYCRMEPVWPEGEPRYLYSKRLVLFSGIADDRPLLQWLSGDYKVLSHLKYPDHHSFTRSDIRDICSAAQAYPTAVVATTEKDSQRIRDVKQVPETLRSRLFRAPIEMVFVGEGEQERFVASLKARLESAASRISASRQ